MTIRQMELFAQVYERRNLTRAAEALYMTQSAVTQNLKKMEEELGVQLFERVNRRLQPSPIGERFYQHAKRILDEYEKALADLAGSGEQMSLYYYDILSAAIKDRVIAAFWEIDPFLRINQHDCRITELLDNSRWTPGMLYLVPEEFIRDPAVRSVDAAAVRHVIIMRENSHLSGMSVIRPEDLEGETLLLRSDRGKQFPHLLAALDQLDELGVHYETAIAERARELAPRILSFGGVAILPEYLKNEVPGIAWRPYDDGIAIHVKLAWKGTLPPRVMKMLAAYQRRTEKKNGI